MWAQEGVVVQLKPENNHQCPAGRINNSQASIRTVGENGELMLHEDLHGCRWWNVMDVQPVHSFDIGELVEVTGDMPEKGIRLFVAEHSVDDEIGATYTLSMSMTGDHQHCKSYSFPEEHPSKAY